MADRLPDPLRLRRTRGEQLPDWLDRLTDARDELADELAQARGHPSTRALIDVARLEATLADWPAPDEAARPDRVVSHRQVLPRSLAVSRYLRWFEEWSRERQPGEHV
jgi:hypothetical protein